MYKICSICFSLVVGLTLSLPALAQVDLARSHFQVGQSYYRQGRYADALREFEQSYLLAKKPALLYNIAQTHERMGRVAKAISFYQRYIKDSGKRDPSLLEKLKNLRAQLKQTGVQVTSAVAGATVIVDGKEVGKTPVDSTIEIKAGSHKIRVRKTGYRTFSAFVAVAVGTVVNVVAEMEPIRDATAMKKARALAPAVEPPDDSAEPPHRLWTWVSAGVAGALIATAAATGIVALGKANDAAHPDDDTARSARTMAVVSDISLGTGLGLATLAVILYFTEGKGESPVRAVVAPAFGRGFAGVSGALTF